MVQEFQSSRIHAFSIEVRKLESSGIEFEISFIPSTICTEKHLTGLNTQTRELVNK